MVTCKGLASWRDDYDCSSSLRTSSSHSVITYSDYLEEKKKKCGGGGVCVCQKQLYLQCIQTSDLTNLSTPSSRGYLTGQ